MRHVIKLPIWNTLIAVDSIGALSLLKVDVEWWQVRIFLTGGGVWQYSFSPQEAQAIYDEVAKAMLSHG